MASDHTHSDRSGVPVAVVRWPAQAELRDRARAEESPCLLIVASPADLPPLAPNEEWMIETPDERDIAWRIEQLRRMRRDVHPRGATSAPVLAIPAEVDENDRRVARVLLQRVDEIVPIAHLGAGDDPDLVPAAIGRLAPVLRTAGWEIVTIADRGYLITEAPR